MRSIFLIAFKKIKNKKLQNFMIGLIIASSALLFSTAVGVIISINNPIEKMFVETKSAHDIFTFSQKFYNANDVKTFIESKSGVDKTQVYNTAVLSNNTKLNGKNIEIDMNLVSEVPKEKADIDNLKFIKGSSETYPKDDEVWISTCVADMEKAKIGDMVTLGNRNFRVSKIVGDAQFGSIMLGTARYWVNDNAIKNIDAYKIQPMKSISVRYKNPSYSKTLWNSFQKQFKGPVIGSLIDYSNIYNCYSNVLKYTGVFMLFFSVIMIVVALFIIKFTISNSIYKDYKDIGIYKSVGFSNGSINLIYIIQYFVISVVSIIIGITLSNFAVDKMIHSELRQIGMEKMNISHSFSSILTFVLLIFVIILASFLSSLKSNRIRPVEAIRNEIPSYNFQIKKHAEENLFSKLSITKAMAVKSIIQNKKSAFLIFITIFIAVYSSMSSINLLNTTRSINGNLGYWGFDNSMVDIRLENGKLNDLDKIKYDLKNYNEVTNMTTSNFYSDTSFVNKENNIEKLQVVQVVGDDADKLGIMEMEGRNPRKENEVSVSVVTARDNGKKVGDYIDVYVKNKKCSLLIVGIYQSLSGLGKGVRLYDGLISRLDPDSIPDILVDVKSKSDIKPFIKKVNMKYAGKVKACDRQDQFKKQIGSMDSDSLPTVIMIVSVMLGVCIFNIFNLTVMDINDEKKNYGIYKAIGMTSMQIRKSIMFKVMMLFVLAVILAVPFTLYVTPALMSMMFINLGIAKYPISIVPLGMALMALLCLVVSILSGFISSKMIQNIKLRNLIEE